MWSFCGRFVVIFRSITGRREYGTVPTRLPCLPYQNKLTTQSMIAILHTEDAEARIIATNRQRPLVSWGRRFTYATSAGERLQPDDPSRDDEDATTESGLLLGSNNQGNTIHKKTELLLWCNRVHGLFTLAVIPPVSPRVSCSLSYLLGESGSYVYAYRRLFLFIRLLRLSCLHVRSYLHWVRYDPHRRCTVLALDSVVGMP